MFYSVIRIFYKGDAETHSVQQFGVLKDAQKRYFNIIATDLADDTVTYQACYIIDSNGLMMEGRVFDRREAEPTEA